MTPARVWSTGWATAFRKPERQLYQRGCALDTLGYGSSTFAMLLSDLGVAQTVDLILHQPAEVFRRCALSRSLASTPFRQFFNALTVLGEFCNGPQFSDHLLS